MIPGDVFEYVLLGVDAIAVGVLYSISRNTEKLVRALLQAPNVPVGPELDNYLQNGIQQQQFMAIRGKVVPAEDCITSSSGLKGVLQLVTLKEHSVRRAEFGYWNDTVKIMNESYNIVPFAVAPLVEGTKWGSNMTVNIQNPLEASFENLLVTVSTNFVPEKQTFSSTILGFFTGRAAKGIETTERLLPVGTVITGIGEVTKNANGAIVLSAPKRVMQLPFILSQLPIESIVERYERYNMKIKLVALLFSAVGMFIIGRKIRRWWRLYKDRQLRTRIIKNRERRDVHQLSDMEKCIVCLGNPREVLTMPCGHVSMCADCLPKLDNKCPVCRANITGTHAAFIA